MSDLDRLEPHTVTPRSGLARIVCVASARHLFIFLERLLPSIEAVMGPKRRCGISFKCHTSRVSRKHRPPNLSTNAGEIETRSTAEGRDGFNHTVLFRLVELVAFGGRHTH